ncbi:hypothetical protein PGB90_007285 [Kerria lacca]
MGLCKCPKRVVTNQFCYEHRVNVCENCMVTNHPKCVVLSYLKWLQDGDYNPICELCSSNLSEDECVRLVCYHVFHWHCLNDYAKQLPATMAPAGYTCPICNSHIFPPSNLVSPVADVLRKKFETVNWARAGLGLPFISEEQVIKRKITPEYMQYQNHSDLNDQQPNNSYCKVETFENKFPDNVPRRLTHSSENKKYLPKFTDHDDNKYERKAGTEKLSSLHSCARKSKYFQFYFRNKYRRYFAIGTFLFFGFFLLMIILEKLSNRNDSTEDTVFNPYFNPNIRVNDADS